MPFLKPLYLLSLPVLLSLTFPLAIFATLTTILAFTILLFRLFIIYTEIGFSLIPHYLVGKRQHSPPLVIPTFFEENGPSPAAISPKTRRSGSSSFSSSNMYLDSSCYGRYRKTRKASLPNIMSRSAISPSTHTNNAPFALPLSAAPPGQRDFEGLGGWALDSGVEEAELFTRINSRLELPGGVELSRSMNHHRRATSGSLPVPDTDSYIYNSVVAGAGSQTRPSSTSLDMNIRPQNFDTNIMYTTDQQQINFISTTKSQTDIPSPNTSRPRYSTSLSESLSVTLLASPELNHIVTKPKPQQRRISRTSSEDYFSSAVLEGIGMRRRSEVVMNSLDGNIEGDGPREGTGTGRLSISSGSSKGSGYEEGLSMKGRTS